MLPAADFVSYHQIWTTFTSVLLLEPLFLDKAPMKLQHINTNLSNSPYEGRLQSLPDIYVYIYSTSFVAGLTHLYRKQSMMLTPEHQKYRQPLTKRSGSGK